jgi:uncharacterized membrane protein YoaK (UPF0700 family)
MQGGFVVSFCAGIVFGKTLLDVFTKTDFMNVVALIAAIMVLIFVVAKT